VNREELRARLQEADPELLASFLAQLAEEDAALRERIEALVLREQPSVYARALDGRLRRLRDGRSFISYRQSSAFAQELETWLDDIETGLLDRDPARAWKLLDAFVRADGNILERADDSNGSIGDAMRRACSLWHRAHAGLPAGGDRVQRVFDLHAGNDYGTRDAILDGAAQSLSETELRELARIYEQAARVEASSDDRYGPSSAAVAMGQIARALRDAELYESSVRIRSPEPNYLQAETIATQYIEFGPVEHAIDWLTRPRDPADRHARERLDLLARAYEKLGDTDALLDIRRKRAEGSLSADLFTEYAALLPSDERDAARRAALERAGQSNDPVAAARFMLDLGEPDLAAATVLRLRDRLSSAFYWSLLELAQDLTKTGHPLPAIACYRTLTNQILEQGRNKAYRHARDYVATLSTLDPAIDDYGDLGSHAAYLASLRREHGRKYSFWQLLGEDTA